MNQRYRKGMKWTLYSLLFLLSMLVGSTILGGMDIFGTKITILPLVIICVACREGHESGGLFALITTVIWTLSGVGGSSIYIVMLCLVSVVAGYFCTTYFTKGPFPAMAACMVGLALSEGTIALQRIYFGLEMPADTMTILAVQMVVSFILAPFIWWMVRLIGKVGG